MVMSPLETDDGWIVYVNRGFVPMQRKDVATRAEGQVDGRTTVVGMLRQPFGLSWFMPADDPVSNSWLSRDPAKFAEAAGYATETVAPYVIDSEFDADLPGGLPQGGETIVAFSNNHLQYALTWFGLAIALVVVFVVFARDRVRGR
jgi:surfeit locus 1 family protein